MMADNIIWLDFNDAPEQRDELASDTDALRAGLLDRLEAVLHYLFPQGRIRGGKFYVGDVDGNPGKSLVVELDGPRHGLWKDFSTDEGGDIIDLWARSQGRSARSDFPRITGEIRQWLGLPTPNITPMRRDIRSVPMDELGAYTAKWDYLSPEGELIACVYRYDPPTGKEYRPWDVRARMWRAPDPRPLYNLPVISKAREVVLVEGEKCAAALIACGIVATTAMNGARAPVDKTDWHPLAGKSVVIWPDRDVPGWDYAESAARACMAAGSTSVAILVPPTDKPAKWDAADAVDEGFDCAAFIAQGERRVVKAAVPALPTFTLGEDEMEMGMGIHGEPGIWRDALKPADAITDEMLDRVLEDSGAGRGERVSVLVNSLGSTPLMELYIMNRRIRQRLDDIGADAAHVGNCRSLAHPDAVVNAVAEVFGEVPVYVAINLLMCVCGADREPVHCGYITFR